MKFFRLPFLLAILLTRLGAEAGTLVQMQFYFGVSDYAGEVDVELYNQDKPITTQNFIKLINSGAYSGGFFHRCVPEFVLQGGGYAAINPFLTNVIGPPYSDVVNVPNFGNITNEYGVGKFYSNTNWTIAMAKTSDPNSANSQFFFNLTNNAATLDPTNNAGGFTVFGHVVRGTNILSYFNSFYYGYGLQDLSQTYGTNGIFTQLPSDATGTAPPPYDELVYFTINTLSLQVKVQTNGARQITWNSVLGVTNNVEYSTNLPPTWQVLTNAYGTGASMTATDSTTNKTSRFYRLHVLF